MRIKELFKDIKKDKKVVIAGCEKFGEIDAAIKGLEWNLFEPILVGNKERIKDKIPKNIKMIDASSPEESVSKALEHISSGEADILMKGSVPTSIFLKGVLKKEFGLLDRGLLSHLAIIDTPSFHKLLMITDGGMCIKPDLNTKKLILDNAINFSRKIGIRNPKVGILAAVEVVNPDMPETLDAAVLSKMAQRGDFGECIVDGPLAMDVMISRDSAEIKGVFSDVAGDVDIILVPDITTGNSVAKSLLYLAGAEGAGIILGTKKPIVMLSRADTMELKLNSILLGILVHEKCS